MPILCAKNLEHTETNNKNDQKDVWSLSAFIKLNEIFLVDVARAQYFRVYIERKLATAEVILFLFLLYVSRKNWICDITNVDIY